jgi:hypothetical protein
LMGVFSRAIKKIERVQRSGHQTSRSVRLKKKR